MHAGVRTAKRTDTDSVIEMLVLDNNVFKFRDREYRQIDGTAIGSRLGRNYACTNVGSWEDELLKTSHIKPWAYLRYVDDIWGIWTGSEDELHAFHELSNQIHPRIKTTIDFSKNILSSTHASPSPNTPFSTSPPVKWTSEFKPGGGTRIEK